MNQFSAQLKEGLNITAQDESKRITIHLTLMAAAAFLLLMAGCIS
jgi:hypothetical protein